jgi:hypothetical protein
MTDPQRATSNLPYSWCLRQVFQPQMRRIRADKKDKRELAHPRLSAKSAAKPSSLLVVHLRRAAPGLIRVPSVAKLGFFPEID